MTEDQILNIISKQIVVGGSFPTGYTGKRKDRRRDTLATEVTIKEHLPLLPVSGKICTTCLEEYGEESNTRREEWVSTSKEWGTVVKCVYRCVSLRPKSARKKNCVPEVYIVVPNVGEILESEYREWLDEKLKVNKDK